MIFIFIIPQNFNFKNKFLGFIDYSTLIFLIICYLISYLIINFIFPSFYTKIIIFIILKNTQLRFTDITEKWGIITEIGSNDPHKALPLPVGTGSACFHSPFRIPLSPRYNRHCNLRSPKRCA